MSETKLIVFVPNPAMGHLLSTVELTKLLVQRDQRFAILVLILRTPVFNNPKVVDAYIESQSHEADPNRITFFTLPPLTALDATSASFVAMIELQKPLIKKVVDDRGIKPAAFILDMLCVDIMDLANELDVPSYVYFTSGANLLSLLFHFQSLTDDDGIDVFNEFANQDAELIMPEFKNPVPARVLPWFGVTDEENEWLKLILNMPRKFRESKGILINTFMELESHVIQVLRDHGKDKIPAIYPVGPILSLDESSRGRTQGDDHDQGLILRWLDEQPPSSVVFLCFGSMGSFDVEQVKEIAKGLDLSGCPFLWSIPERTLEGNHGGSRKNDNFDHILPDGFMDRTAHRGKILGWAPQVLILAHCAIGGFVTHCGWNSILESLWFGVPMATWPIYSEQQLNAFELVKELQLAVEISIEYRLDFKTTKGNFLVTAEEVVSGVKKLMNLDGEMRARLQEIKDLSRTSFKDGGSSNQWLVRFIDDVLDDERQK